MRWQARKVEDQPESKRMACHWKEQRTCHRLAVHPQHAFNKNTNQLSSICNKAAVVNHQWHTKIPPHPASHQDEWEPES